MKECSKCGELKPLTEFYKRNARKCGYQSSCKVCSNKVHEKYSHTREGLLTKIYKGQVNSSKLRGHKKPNYTKDELRIWLFNHPSFNELFKSWELSNYNIKLVPSCDRLDDKKPYSFDNIRLITWEENNKKSHEDMRNGTLRELKGVAQLSKDGEFISASEAAIKTGSRAEHICRCCNGKAKTTNGFKWQYIEVK